ncbi:MAG: sugar-binding transcriptional regulator [Armatimonadota bacterium]|nr:sugar-binding transcriptional regulator [Armatimonadota bacterium]MDR7485104.1 sugar-binding transcriptional regulator [Armatimonadota bacterium]MDR7533492.1 sugar-binding transcriptional regulator [Armatimonadota bacterium]MDR7537007.1 sugar-binding transcriptional regulator [Armatimonadota bacterium]
MTRHGHQGQGREASGSAPARGRGAAALLAKVADLYYLRDLTQQEIAGRLGLSRPTVSRLLRRSRDLGVVRIEIVAPPDSHHDLERALEECFGLREAIVVTGDADDAAATRRALGRAGARYLERALHGGERLGVSWGTTLRAVVDHLRGRPLRLTIVPLVGGVGQVAPGIHANDLAAGLAAAFAGQAHLLHAPAIVASPGLRRALLADVGIRRVLALARQVDVALVGIGALVPSSTLVRSGYFSAGDLAQLRRRGAVGDICTRAYTGTGASVDGALDRRILAVSLDDLRRIGTVVAVAGGPEKAAAIAGALRGGLIDVLVTDHLAAAALLEIERASWELRAAAVARAEAVR